MTAERKIRVLLVEDNPTDVLLTTDALERENRFDLSVVERLSRAIELLNDRPLDVVLLDLGLPDSQGVETLLALRSSNPTVPVVVMTARDDEELALRAVAGGAQDYLVKGQMRDGALARAIRHAIERRRVEDALAESLRERAALAAVSADVGLAFTRGGVLREMLHACVESMVGNLEAAFARVWMLNETEQVLELQASAGVYTHLDGPHGRVPVGMFKIGLIAAEREPHLTNNVAHDPRVSDPEWARREGMVAFAGYPLLLEDRLVGVMAMFSRKELTEATLQVMATVANLIALGIERKRTEESLRHAEMRFRALIEHSPDAVWLHAADASILYSSPAGLRTLGYSDAELIGQSPFPLTHPEDQERLGGVLAELMREPGASIAFEIRARHKDGSWRCCEVTATNLLSEPSIQAIVSNWRDITDRKRLEAQVRQAQKMDAIGCLAGGIAHDFNNLLTIINGYSDLIAAELPADSPLGELVHEIAQAGKRAASLTRQLLAFSRKQVLEPKVLNINALVTDTTTMMQRLIGEDVELSVTLAPGLGQVKADPGQIDQVVINLAVNARDAMPQGGKLTIETSNVDLDETYTRAYPDVRPGRYARLSVSDNGHGMDAATKARVFEPFFTTKGPGKGTGLGLATVFGIVKQSGGHITVYSEPGHGTVFKIYLPIVEEVRSSDRPGSLGESSLRGSETILLVEDEPPLRALIRRILQMHGYTVFDAGQGDKALRMAEDYKGRIHVLVTDVVMPAMSGRQLAERLTAARPEVKVLYLSGYTDDAIVRHGVLEAGMAFLQKPLTPRELARKVREVLDGEGPR